MNLVGGDQRTPFPANVKAWPPEGLRATCGYALCEGCSAARPPSCRRLARSSSPSRRPWGLTLHQPPLLTYCRAPRVTTHAGIVGEMEG
eukprot:5519590-Prymnesium_polylepis.1